MYTLQDYYKAAGLKHPVAFAKHLQLSFAPWKHQVVGLRRLLKYDTWGLYDDPATGKTLTAQAYSLFWVSEGQKVLWIMPPSLLGQWRESFSENFIGLDTQVNVEIFNGSPAKRKKQVERWQRGSVPPVLGVGYQLFTRGAWKDFRKWGYKVVVMDEAHKVKNAESNIFKIIDQHFSDGNLVPMTGTPLHRELKDTYTLIKMTNPAAYRSYDHFSRAHFLYRKVKFKQPKIAKNGRRIYGFKDHYGYQGEAKIAKALYHRASRVIRKDVMDIKDPQIVEVPVTLDPKHKALYKKLMRERILELSDGELITALTEVELRQKALQIVTCPELFVPEGEKIVNEVAKCAADLLDGCGIWQSKAIMFLHYRQSVQAFAEHFKEYNPALMYGGSNTEKNRKKFLDDDSCRLLIANVKSAGEGFNFQYVSNTIIYPEPTSVPGDFKQSMERVVRKGQEREVSVYVLKVLNTVAVKATQVMLGRQQVVRRVNQDSSTFLDYFQVA